ncbi:MAG TPA: sulfotransferase [Arenimonas sp.]|nr:sulfotransferase [Arenimonas sp.]
MGPENAPDSGTESRPGPRYLRDNAYLIACPPRCGSTMLVTLLRSHPQILSYGEVFGKGVINGLTGRYQALVDQDPAVREQLLEIRTRTPVHFLYKFVLDARAREVVGFKFKYDEMLLEEHASLLDAIHCDTDIKIIFLWRENLLARHLSHAIVEKVTGVTMLRATDRDLDIPPIRIDIDALLSDIERQQQRRARFRRLFSMHRSLELGYESLLADPVTERGRLTDFLGVNEHPLAPATKKNVQRPIHEAISNFQEVRAALKGAGLESFCE